MRISNTSQLLTSMRILHDVYVADGGLFDRSAEVVYRLPYGNSRPERLNVRERPAHQMTHPTRSCRERVVRAGLLAFALHTNFSNESGCIVLDLASSRTAGECRSSDAH